MIDWFINWQLRIILILGAASATIVFLSDFRGIQIIFSLLFSLALIYLGQKLYTTDSSENWLNFSSSYVLKNVIGTILMLSGWIVFLNEVFALAIASLWLRIS